MENAKLLYFFPSGNYSENMAFRFVKHQKNPQSPGPVQGSGMLITPFEKSIPKYDPKNQDWKIMAGVHIGVAKNAIPADFAREHTESGYPVTLGDGKEWIIPVARLNSPNFSFPQFETMDEEGNWIWKVQEPYLFICEIANRLFDATDDDNNFVLEESILRRACCAAIGINYNLTEMECAALGLLTHEAYKGIVSALLDEHGFARMLEGIQEGKKKL